MANGYIKLHRSIIEWGWIDDLNTMRLWLQLLCTVMWERTEYKGITLEPGQRIASLSKLSEETGLSIRQIRTARDHLISTGEVIVGDTAYGSLITVANWAKYQERQEQSDTGNDTTADKRPTRDMTSDRHKNEEGEEDKNIINFAHTPTHARTHDAIKEEKFDVNDGREVRPGIWMPNKRPVTDEEKRANFYKVREVFRAYKQELEKENDDD